MPLVNILFWSVFVLLGIIVWVSVKRHQKFEEEQAALLKTLFEGYKMKERYRNPLNIPGEILFSEKEEDMEDNMERIYLDGPYSSNIDYYEKYGLEKSMVCPKCGHKMHGCEWYEIAGDYTLVEVVKECPCKYKYHWAYGNLIEG